MLYNSLRHTHNVDYLLKLCEEQGCIDLKVYNLRVNKVKSGDSRKLSDLTPAKVKINNYNGEYIQKYKDALYMFNVFKKIYSKDNNWEHFILGGE